MRAAVIFGALGLTFLFAAVRSGGGGGAPSPRARDDEARAAINRLIEKHDGAEPRAAAHLREAVAVYARVSEWWHDRTDREEGLPYMRDALLSMLREPLPQAGPSSPRQLLVRFEEEGLFDAIDRASKDPVGLTARWLDGVSLDEAQSARNDSMVGLGMSVFALAATARLAHHAGDDAQFARRIDQALMLGPARMRGLVLIDVLLGISFQRTAMEEIRSVCREREPSAAACRAALTSIDRWAGLPPLRDTLEAELAFMLAAVAETRQWNDPTIDQFAARMREKWASLEAIERLPLAKVPVYEVEFDFSENPKLGSVDRQVARTVKTLGHSIRIRHEHRLNVAGTRVMLALALHRAERGVYPAELAALVPAYLDQLPVDPLSGEAFVYRVIDERAANAAGYALYSVGVDGRDDGGVMKSRSASVEDTDYVINAPRPTAMRDE